MESGQSGDICSSYLQCLSYSSFVVIMEAEKVVPTGRELGGFDLSNPDVIDLIHHAQASDAADRQLTLMQALKKYKKAVFWAMILSTSLIMEGYDVVMVCPFALSKALCVG